MLFGKKKKGVWEELKENNVPVVNIPKSVQDLIQIESITKDGIFEIEPDNGDLHVFDRVYRFSDINFMTKDAEEREKILIQYCGILNGMNANFKFVICNFMRNAENLDDVYEERPEHNEHQKDLVNAYNKIINSRRINEAFMLEQNKYLVLTTKKKNYSDAELYFDQMEASLYGEFGEIGSSLEKVDGVERLNILYQAYRISPSVEYAKDWNDFLATEYKDSIAPLAIELVDRRGKQYLKIDDHYATTLTVRKNGYPNRLSNKFMANLTMIPFASIITLDITPIPTDVTIKVLKRKLDSVETKIANQQEIRNRNEQYSSDITRDVKKEKQNIEQYLDEVTENDQTMFFSQLLITVFDHDIDSLDSKVETIQQMGKTELLDIAPYCMQQIEAFNTALPLGGRYVNTMLRTLFTNALVCFAPFNVQQLYHKKGIFYGVNILSKKVILADRKKLVNGNGWIFGVTGTGKSFAAKMEIGQVLVGTDDDVIIIDPQGEYEKFVTGNGGQYINLSATAKTYMNPLEISNSMAKENMEGFITTKSEFVLDIITQMKGKELDLNQRSEIDKATRRMYTDILMRPEGKWESPTFKELKRYLENLGTETSDLLSKGLYIFTEGSLDLFAHQSNVRFSNRLLAFNTKNLGDSLRKLSMLIMLESIRGRLNDNQLVGKPTWVYVDEAHEITGEETSAAALERSWKEIRKQGGLLTGITQNIVDTLMTKTTRNMVANSEFILLLGQSNIDLTDLFNVIDVSANEMHYVQNKSEGKGLLRFGDTIVPIDNKIDKDSLLYELYNTNLHEKIEQGVFD